MWHKKETGVSVRWEEEDWSIFLSKDPQSTCHAKTKTCVILVNKIKCAYPLIRPTWYSNASNPLKTNSNNVRRFSGLGAVTKMLEYLLQWQHDITVIYEQTQLVRFKLWMNKILELFLLTYKSSPKSQRLQSIQHVMGWYIAIQLLHVQDAT